MEISTSNPSSVTRVGLPLPESRLQGRLAGGRGSKGAFGPESARSPRRRGGVEVIPPGSPGRRESGRILVHRLGRGFPFPSGDRLLGDGSGFQGRIG